MDEVSIHNTVMRLIKKTEEQQKVLLRSFVKMPLEGRMKIMELNRDIFYPLKQENKDLPIPLLSYASMILAITNYQNQTSELDKNLIELRAKSLRKQPKKEKLVGKWALIKLLKNDKKLSFRKIANYLEAHHDLIVVHSTISDVWNEFEVTNKKGNI
jgi:hypothetical protein